MTEQRIPRPMTPSRLETFSDGVIAIIITIMVLDLKAPTAMCSDTLLGLAPRIWSYVLSFLLIAIMWVNHHFLLMAIHRVDRPVLWANVHVLFWMSLIPFGTDAIGESPHSPFAVGMYAFIVGTCIGAFSILRIVMLRRPLKNKELAHYHSAVQKQNYIAVATYYLAIPLAYVSIYISYAILVMIPMFYFLPGRLPKLTDEE